MTSIEQPTLLNYLKQLAEAKDAPPVESVLRQLAQFYAASGIGAWCVNSSTMAIARVYDGARIPDPLPWQADGSMVDRSRAALSALSHGDANGAWLVSLAWEPRQDEALLVWLFRPNPGAWRDVDAALWPLAAQTLVRCVAQQGNQIPLHTCTLQKLEQVAQVTSRLSHDFGNFLTGILGFTELSIAQAPAEGLLSRYLHEVLQAAKQGSDWIRRLHWYCRRNGQFSWPTEFSSILEETQSRSATGTSVRWEKHIPADLPLLAIDAASLQAMLLELVNNTSEAAKAANKTIALTISARATELADADCHALLGNARAGKFVEIALTDDGPGFTPEACAKVFTEIFYSSKPRQRGLGFLVVYGILHRFRGGLRFGPGPKGQGARVEVYVPAATVDSVAASGQEAPRVLVVHPDPLLFESLRKILEWQGYRVTVALTAQAALSIYQAQGQSIALVLAEALLPQLSGFDLARRIIDRDAKANFLFLYTQSSFHGLPEEEMLKRFPLLRWPLETSAFVQAVRRALTRNA